MNEKNRKTHNQKEKLKEEKIDISILEAGVKSLSKEMQKIEKDVSDIRAENKNIIIGATIALVFIFITIAIEVLVFHIQERVVIIELQGQYLKEVERVKDEILTNE